MFIGYVAFNEDSNTKNLEEAYKELNKAKEENVPEKELLIAYDTHIIIRDDFFQNFFCFVYPSFLHFLMGGCSQTKTAIRIIISMCVRIIIIQLKDDIVYTAINLAGFWDVILPNPSCLLTDKQGNEVESCIIRK